MILSDGRMASVQDASSRLLPPSTSFVMPSSSGPVKQRHGALGEVAPLGDRPLVVDLEQDGPARRRTAASSGKMPDHVAAPLDLLVDPLERVGAPDLLPVGEREGGEGRHVLARLREHRGDDREPRRQLVDDRIELLADRPASGWAKMVRLAARTISALPLGMRAKTLRRKCTRQTPSVNLRSSRRLGGARSSVDGRAIRHAVPPATPQDAGPAPTERTARLWPLTPPSGGVVGGAGRG